MVAYDGLGMFLDDYYIASDAQQLETSRLGDTYEINEKLTTLYAKLDFDDEFGPGMLLGNVGLQYQQSTRINRVQYLHRSGPLCAGRPA